MKVFKIEDFVINELFRPYASEFIDEDPGSKEFKQMEKTFEHMIRTNPECIINYLENLPEAKEKVLGRLKRFGGISWYRYLDMKNPVIVYINKNL